MQVRCVARVVMALVLGLGACAPMPALADDGALVSASAEQDPFSSEASVEGELLVIMDAGREPQRGSGMSPLSAGQIEAVGQVEQVEQVAEGADAFPAVVKASLAPGADAAAAAREIAALSGVARVQPNYRYRLIEDMPEPETLSERLGKAVSQAISAQAVDVEDSPAPADDPQLRNQYYLGSYEKDHGANVLAAWEDAKADYSVTVAVLDTGCRVDHEDLVGTIDTANMWDAYTNTKRGVITSPEVRSGDNVGHGTHVCGIVAAQANNGLGIAGVSHNANVLPVKVFDNNFDPYCYSDTADIVKAYRYLFGLVDDGKLDDLRVVNMSLGSYDEEEGDDLLEEAINVARDHYGVVTVCAGGNGVDGVAQTVPCYPGDFDACVSVTALDSDGTNVSWSDYNKHKDISAPGVGILSTYYTTSRYYERLSGTSMASPLVAGVFALLWAKQVNLEVEEALEAVYETAAPVLDDTSKSRAGKTGSHGVIDAAAAVKYVGENFDVGEKSPLSNAEIEPVSDQFWTGRAIEPVPVVRYGEKLLQPGEDFRVTYLDNVHVGTASVAVTGRGAYSGRVSVPFGIFYDIDDARVAGVAQRYDYTGAAIEPSCRVSFAGRALLAGRDYVLSYMSNTLPGTGYVHLEGRGDYRGSKDVAFEIASRDVADAVIAGLAERYPYTGAAIEPDFDIVYDNRLLAKGWDYQVYFEDNVEAGMARVAVRGIGEFSGERVESFEIYDANARTVSEARPATPVVSRDTSAVAGERAVDSGEPTAGSPTGSPPAAAAADSLTPTSASPSGSGGLGDGAAGDAAVAGDVRNSEKKAQKIVVKAQARTVKYAKLKKKAQTVSKAVTVKGAKTALSYAKVAKGSSDILAVNKKTGEVAVKKGAEKGVYRVKVRVTAKATGEYKSASKTVTVRVRVK